MNKQDPIFVAGHRGLVGSAIVRALRREGFDNLLLRDRQQLDLTQRPAVDAFLAETRPAVVIVAAAKVGGILANSSAPADFLRDNLQIQTNLIDGAYRHGARKLLFLGSSCIYPKFAPQPMPEECLLSGPLEPTNEWYAVAKIAGIKMCQAYRRQYGFDAIAAMPTNLYGPGDNFSLETSHVLPALMRKCHEARLEGRRELVVWGTGQPRREFLHVDDLAMATLFLLQKYSDEQIINVGTGTDVSILELVHMIARVTGFAGDIVFDTTKPDGTPRKLLDVSRIHDLGWRASIGLEDGIRQTYDWFVQNSDHLRA